MTKMKYSTPSAFRKALEDQLDKISKKEQTEIQMLRRQVAFDRLLARLFSSNDIPWVLKGGYAMQLRIDSARATKDVDLSLRESKLKGTSKKDQPKVILEMLQEKAQVDLDDYFEFILSGPTDDLDGAPYGGARYHVEARIDDRTFEKFQIDVGVGDCWIEPHEKLETRAWLPSGGIDSQVLPAIPKEQQFAEKLHAYTLPRKDRPNSRVKDLIDMLLLVEGDEMNDSKVVEAISDTFEKRDTHQFESSISPPPNTWGASFTSMAIKTGLETDMNQGFQSIYGYVQKLPFRK